MKLKFCDTSENTSKIDYSFVYEILYLLNLFEYTAADPDDDILFHMSFS